MTLKEELEVLRGEPIGVFTGDPIDIPCIETSDAEKLCKHPVVSVNMITYNHEPYIRQAIEGVMMQKTDFEFELIIGEDASTDKTREICFEYQKKYPEKIRVLWWHENLRKVKHPAGGNLVRNAAHCRGEFIAICEGDDYWTDPLKLQKQVDLFRRDDRLSIVYTDFQTLCASDGRLSDAILLSSGFFAKMDSFENKNYLTEQFPGVKEPLGFFATASIMYRKDKLESYEKYDVLAPLRLSLGDYQLRTRAALCGKVGFVKDPCAVYRLGSGVLWATFRRGDIKMAVDIWYVKYMRTWDLLTPNEQLDFVQRCLDSVLRVERCDFRTKCRALRFSWRMARSYKIKLFGPVVRLLIMFHIIPQFLMTIKRKLKR